MSEPISNDSGSVESGHAQHKSEDAAFSAGMVGGIPNRPEKPASSHSESNASPAVTPPPQRAATVPAPGEAAWIANAAAFEEWLATLQLPGAYSLPLWVREKMKTAWDAARRELAESVPREEYERVLKSEDDWIGRYKEVKTERNEELRQKTEVIIMVGELRAELAAMADATSALREEYERADRHWAELAAELAAVKAERDEAKARIAELTHGA